MEAEPSAPKRRCVSTACIACRRRKSKCDGNIPSCAACSSVYHTPCIYDPNSDHRRKGVYKKEANTLRTRHTTLQTLFHAILNYEEEDAFELVRQIRSCDDLEHVAQSVTARDKGILDEAANELSVDNLAHIVDQFETELSGKMSELMLDGSGKFIGGTSNLIFLPPDSELHEPASYDSQSVRRWTQVTEDESLIGHLLNMYFTWHYSFFTVLSKELFYRDYIRGVASPHCSALLVNSMLALGCHFSSRRGVLSDPENPTSAGNHFFKEAKRLILENDEHENSKLCTVQAFALMSLREAGCGREGKGWVYSGLSFRMACDLGLNVDASNLGTYRLSDEEIDARRITFWGCYLIDKLWSNYLGRQPQLSSSNTSTPKIDVLPREEMDIWSPYTDAGAGKLYTQPCRTRAVALQISILCEISNDLLLYFYHPVGLEKSQSKQSERKKLTDIHTRLEAWKSKLPAELEAKEGQLPQVLVMHMFHQLLLIHLYRPFLKYNRSNTPLPSHVSPRRICTQAASAISRILRMYKRTYGLVQICNVVVYITHTACTIHLLNLPEKNAQRDVIHGVRSIEEMAESWLCARRTLGILDMSAKKWQVELPADAIAVFERTRANWGLWGSWDHSGSSSGDSPSSHSKFQSSVTSPDPSLLPMNPVLSEAHQQHSLGGSSMVRRYYPTAAQTDQDLLESSQPFHQDTTYLHPTQVGYQISTIAPADQSPTQSPSPPTWLGLSNTQIPQTMSPTSNVSALSGLEGLEHLVDESHDWWSRNATAALGTGMETWTGPWSPGNMDPARNL